MRAWRRRCFGKCLRELQRKFQVAVMLVHHARKDSQSSRPGEALRGSSELHGWGDSNLYMRRKGSQLTLSTEHRTAASQDPHPAPTHPIRLGRGLAGRGPLPPCPRRPRPARRNGCVRHWHSSSNRSRFNSCKNSAAFVNPNGQIEPIGLRPKR
jgi:hypothetical protein